MGWYLQSRDGEICVPRPSWRKILVREASGFAQERKKGQRRK